MKNIRALSLSVVLCAASSIHAGPVMSRVRSFLSHRTDAIEKCQWYQKIVETTTSLPYRGSLHKAIVRKDRPGLAFRVSCNECYPFNEDQGVTALWLALEVGNERILDTLCKMAQLVLRAPKDFNAYFFKAIFHGDPQALNHLFSMPEHLCSGVVLAQEVGECPECGVYRYISLYEFAAYCGKPLMAEMFLEHQYALRSLPVLHAKSRFNFSKPVMLPVCWLHDLAHWDALGIAIMRGDAKMVSWLMGQGATVYHAHMQLAQYLAFVKKYWWQEEADPFKEVWQLMMPDGKASAIKPDENISFEETQS